MSKIRKKDLFINRYGELNYLFYFILKIVHFREKLLRFFSFDLQKIPEMTNLKIKYFAWTIVYNVRDVFVANCTFIIFVQHVILSHYTSTYTSHRRTHPSKDL